MRTTTRLRLPAARARRRTQRGEPGGVEVRGRGPRGGEGARGGRSTRLQRVAVLRAAAGGVATAARPRGAVHRRDQHDARPDEADAPRSAPAGAAADHGEPA